MSPARKHCRPWVVSLRGEPGLRSQAGRGPGRAFDYSRRSHVSLFKRGEQRTIPERPGARFRPANGGLCAVSGLERGLEIPGNPRFGVLYRGHLFLCASAEDRRRFLEDPAGFERVGVAENGYCCTASAITEFLCRATGSMR